MLNLFTYYLYIASSYTSFFFPCSMHAHSIYLSTHMQLVQNKMPSIFFPLPSDCSSNTIPRNLASSKKTVLPRVEITTDRVSRGTQLDCNGRQLMSEFLVVSQSTKWISPLLIWISLTFFYFTFSSATVNVSFWSLSPQEEHYTLYRQTNKQTDRQTDQLVEPD